MKLTLNTFRYLLLGSLIFMATTAFTPPSAQPITFNSGMFQMLQPATVLDYVIEDEIIMLTVPASAGTTASDLELVTDGHFTYEGETMVVHAKLVNTTQTFGRAKTIQVRYNLSTLRKFHEGRIILDIQGAGITSF